MTTHTQTEFEWVRKYRNIWKGISAFADITSKQGKDTIVTVIERFDATTSAVFSRAMPMVAVVAEVIALYAALSAMLPWYITVLASTVLIMIPVVATRYMFLAPSDQQKTFRALLIAYYLLAFALVFLLKIFVTAFNASSLAWLILPALSVLAVVLYGKTLSIELPEEKLANETAEQLTRAMSFIDEMKAEKDSLKRELSEKDLQLETLSIEITTLQEQLKVNPEPLKPTPLKRSKASNTEALQRRSQLLQILFERYESESTETVNKSAIAKELGTSHTTIGNDIRWLEKNYKIDTTSGTIKILKP